MNFQELLEQLPDCPGPAVLPIRTNPGGFRYIQKGIPEFVSPDLQPSTQISQPVNPQVMIISAAGAVGKSTLAREVAARKSAPIWDLAIASAVGVNSMDGQLTASFGFSLAAQVSERLIGGELFLIVDALDEARVKANEAGFETFIENIAEIAKGTSGTSIVLFGRTQTAETTWLLLADAGVNASLVTIQPFTRMQAEQYIEARIQHFDKVAAKRIADHRQPFVSARDLILNHLERAVGGEDALTDDAVREFLGYAPVLETVAVLLAREGNYQDFISTLSGSMNDEPNDKIDRPLNILSHVVTRLLEREQKEKLQANIKPAMEKVAEEHGWNAWDTLYSPREQINRLLSLILGLQFETCPAMPASLRTKYEEQLGAWLPEHPFLRDACEPANKVFESYLFAIAIREHRTQLGRSVEQRIAASDYKPSRLLADFYILLGDQRGEGFLPEKHIGLLYDSLLSGETDSLRIRLTVESGDPDYTDIEETGGEGEFELVYTSPDGNGEQINSRTFKIADEQGFIEFRRQLKDATIITRGTVVLGGDVDDFEIGPSVNLRCHSLRIRSMGLVVRSAKTRLKESEGVVLEAIECDSTVSRKPLVRGSLSVSWPEAKSYPWSDFALEPIDDEIDGNEMHEVHRRFRRIVTSLRSHSKGSLARFRDKVEHRRVLKNAVGQALLRKLLADGIMKLEDKFYHWCPERADEVLKVSWSDLQRRRVTPELKVYLKGFIDEHGSLF